MIDIDKFIASLLHQRRFLSDNENGYIIAALKEQGLEFRDGSISKVEPSIPEIVEEHFDEMLEDKSNPDNLHQYLYGSAEDEKIRKWIINEIQYQYDIKNCPDAERAIAWLEKQGKNNMGISEATKQELEDSLNKALEKETPESCNEFLEKQGKQILANSAKTCKDEQKPAEWTMDNIEELTEFENAMMHIGGSFFGEHQGLDPNDTFVVKEQAKILLEMAPKQEWSAKDENFLNTTIAYLRDAYSKDKIDFKDTAKNCVNWLKCLKERYSWKPSEEQLECLGYAIEKAEKDWSPLANNRIYFTLKALKEQLLELMESKV